MWAIVRRRAKEISPPANGNPLIGATLHGHRAQAL